MLNSNHRRYVAKRLNAEDAPPLPLDRFIDEQLARYFDAMAKRFDQLQWLDQGGQYRRFIEPYGEAGGSVQVVCHREETGEIAITRLRIVWRFPNGSTG